MKSPKHIPPLCRTEPSLGAGTGLDQVVKLLGDPADIVLAADDHLLDGDERSEGGTANAARAAGNRADRSACIKSKVRWNCRLHIRCQPVHYAKDSVV